MPDLLLELRSEEIPARMQRKAAGDLRKMITDGLVEAGLTYEAAREYWTPRRLTLDIRGLTARSRDISEERKGPSTKATEQAIQGFLRSAGLSSIEEAHVHSDPKKGEFYVAHIVKPGRGAEEIIAELVPAVIRAFPWPKSMRWGVSSGPKGVRYGNAEGLGGETLRWVRPLQSIVCTFGPETEEPVVVDFEVGGIRSGNLTYGHRFHSPGAISVRRFDDYAAKLAAARVVVDAERRKEMILADARNLAFANGLELVEDEGLLEEVAGLVEWPVVLMGEFDADFLAIPGEVIRLTIRANQKCFVTRDTGTSGGPSTPNGEKPLSNRFILIANIEASDGGREIALGNGKVVRARLSDALYFWKTDQSDLPDLGELSASAAKFGLDLAKPLDQRMARLDHLGVTFHAKLGTQGERVDRIARLAEELAPLVGADPALARRGALLAKADLPTEIVGEFPELQGAMGRKYALLQGEHPSVAAAIEEHYKPQGPSDAVPTDPVSIAVALADKLDTLVGFWAIDEKPTGSKDPYALRRAALGVIRIVVENGISLDLGRLFDFSLRGLGVVTTISSEIAKLGEHQDRVFERTRELEEKTRSPIRTEKGSVLSEMGELQIMLSSLGSTKAKLKKALEEMIASVSSPENGTLSFFHDRLKVYLRDKGARHDLIDAVLAAGGSARAISPLAGEMSGKPAVGGAVPQSSPSADVLRPQPSQPYDMERGHSAGVISPLAGGPKDGRDPRLAPQAGRAEGGASRQTSTNDDLLSVVRRVEALGAFLDTDAGKNLLAGTRRAANILAAEEKKGTAVAAKVDPALLTLGAEKTLFAAVNQAEINAAQAIEREDYSAAMLALSALREPVDSFFEDVHVNDEDAAVRSNRLALLSRIRSATGQVADFSRIAG